MLYLVVQLSIGIVGNQASTPKQAGDQAAKDPAVTCFFLFSLVFFLVSFSLASSFPLAFHLAFSGHRASL